MSLRHLCIGLLSAEAGLEGSELIFKFLRQFVAELGIMLFDHRKLFLPAFGIDLQQLGEVSSTDFILDAGDVRSAALTSSSMPVMSMDS